jgi:hypothetical protein
MNPLNHGEPKLCVLDIQWSHGGRGCAGAREGAENRWRYRATALDNRLS